MNGNNVNEQIKNQKKTIIIVFLCLVGFVLLYFLLSIVDWNSMFKSENPSKDKDYIYFYDEKYSKNLDEDEIYMGYDRTINYLVEATGVSETIREEDRSGYSEAVNLLYSMVEYMIIGNVEGYNSCFSPTYFSKASPESGFTKQKPYNITIIEVSQTDKKDEGGKYYTEYYFKLDYMIRHNNGSLRDDVGSDGIKTQHIYMSDKTGSVLIDTIFTLNPIN